MNKVRSHLLLRICDLNVSCWRGSGTDPALTEMWHKSTGTVEFNHPFIKRLYKVCREKIHQILGLMLSRWKNSMLNQKQWSGLPWQPGCLERPSNPSVVATLSYLCLNKSLIGQKELHSRHDQAKLAIKSRSPSFSINVHSCIELFKRETDFSKGFLRLFSSSDIYIDSSGVYGLKKFIYP